ncbi:MAG: hypothetical protein GF350_01950 [Chitinivibrionales bacterium]|nr:hypothetical protein [Chitinivibrionales bacterium]
MLNLAKTFLHNLTIRSFPEDWGEAEIRPQNSEPGEEQLRLISQSINDVQGSIGVVDGKLKFLAVFQVAPLARIDDLIIFFELRFETAAHQLATNQIPWQLLPVLIFLVFWFLGILCTFSGISAISDPSRHIKGWKKTTLTQFFPGELFSPNILDLLIDRPSLSSSIGVEEYMKTVPKKRIDILQILCFERMKLAYIFSMKILRQQKAFFFTIMWGLAGASLIIVP